MNNGRKISSKYFPVLIFTVLLFTVTLNSPANYSPLPRFYKPLTAGDDTIRPLPVRSRENILKYSINNDSTGKDTVIERTDTFNLKIAKDTLDAPINYSASDSIVMGVPEKTITLYNKSNVKQKDITLDAYKIVYDQNKQIMVATYTKDTSGNMDQRPKMVQAQNTIESDSMVYNTRNQKGITQSSYTTSGDMIVYGEKMKKISPTEYYALNGRFTTCNLDTPHFAFRAKKMKLIQDKFAITGPVHPEFEGVPLPIYIPFGFFPLVTGRHSGLLPPQFTASDQFGLGLTGLGYYKVLGPNFDVKVATDLYSYGGWNLYIDPEYYVRYHYRGHVNFSYQDTRILNPTGVGTSEFQDTKTYSFAWSHTVDSKANPGTTFAANVNLQSLKYNQFVLNNPTANYTNSINSSIAYSKTWEGKYNLTASANHSQNSNDGLISFTLPNVGFTATTIYPFQRKEMIGAPKWYEKLGIGLTSNLNNSASIYDSLFSIKKLIDTFQWGAHHSLPITLALPQMGVFQIAPGMSFQQNWYSQKMYIQGAGKYINQMDTSVTKGFFTESNATFSLGASTAIFGTFNKFGPNSSIIGIRHVMRPTISLSYSPNLAGKDYYTATNDSSGITQRLNYFQGSTFGPFAAGRFGGINFALDNSLEMKVKSKSDTSSTGVKKIKLIDAFGITGSYNYLADSNALSPLSIYLRSTLFDKINITASTQLDPYVKDSLGNDRKNFFAWQQKGKFSLGSITQGTLAISTSFKSAPIDKKLDDEKKAAQDQNPIPLTTEEQQAQMNYIATHAAEFADFNVQWSVNLSFSLNFNRTLLPNFSGYETVINSGLNWSGDFNLTPKWKLGMSSYYDVKNEKINSLSMSISRDLHCWQMSINVIPVGITRSFNITISPKASILQDLKVNRSRYFYTE